MIKTFKQIKPKIYGYIHPDYEPHNGYIKIGYTEEENVEKRVKTDHITSNIKYKIVFETDAVNDENIVFTDREFHRYLELNGYERLDDLTKNRKSGKPEFFKITLEELQKEIIKFKKNIFSYEGKSIPYFLRDEQETAINLTIEYYNKCMVDNKLSQEFLWNAKPRFGKTLTAYTFAKAIKSQRILILTNRPAIQDSWFNDYLKYIKNDTEYSFLSAKPISVNLNNKIYRSFSREEQIKYNLSKKPYIFFISLQDIKGRINETDFKQKNKWIFDNDLIWDLVIIDESHEGVETSKANFVLKKIKRKFTLHLSGTPFKAIASQKFSSEQIFNWSYVDEQEMKNNWNFNDGENPYLKLPKMNIYTYKLSTALETKLEEALLEDKGYAFDLTDFFRINNGDFVFKDEIIKFLDNLSGLNPNFDPKNKPYPFATEEIRKELKHTFWLLPNRVDIVKAMKKLLKEHKVFKEYEIILAAGSGDDDGIGKRALEKVKNAIKNYDKTITLSCGQLTTGITIPEWTGVLMLANTESPSLYLQTAFRAQNPYEYTDSKTLKTIYKTDCYLFDFAPDRVLKIIADYASNHINDGSVIREHKVKKMLNFLTVLAEDDEGKLKELDAREVLELPLKIITEEVISRGFMSNKLFDNIANVFGASTEIKEILNKLHPERNGKLAKVKPMDDSNIEVDEFKNIVYKDIEIEKLINTSNGLLGEKQYVIEGTKEALAIEEKLNKIATNQLELNEEEMKELDNINIISKEEEYELAMQQLIKQKEKDKNSEENQIRDRLRGFSRTIPTFLMAYGRTENRITLDNFDTNIPEKDFLEVTSITKEEFHKLKDAKLFNQEVFDASISDFMKTKRRLANYFKDEGEDIFDYIPPQKTNQIFTPKSIVKKMIDLLELNDQNIFRKSNVTFADLYMKSGLFMAEIIKRLYNGLKDEIPNEKERIIHILTNQIYGLAPTNILYNICIEYIFGFLKEEKIIDVITLYKITNNIKEKNIVDFISVDPNYQVGKEVFNKDMKFDVIVGNPPYQGTNHSQLYPYFYLNSINNANNVCLIFPIGWQHPKNGNNLKYLNCESVKSDSQIVFIDNIQNAFPGVAGAEWVNIIYWKRGYNNNLSGNQLVYTNSKKPVSKKLIWNAREIQKPKEIIELVNIVEDSDKFESLQKITSSRNPFGFSTNFAKEFTKFSMTKVNEDDIKVYGNKNKIVYIPSKFPIPKSNDSFNKYKVLVPYAWGNMNEKSGLGGAYSNIIVASPREISTETYLVSGEFNDKETAKKHAKYLMTKFARALLYANKTSHHSTTSWGAIPLQDYSEKWWDEDIELINQKLMEKYNIDEKIVDFINNNIQQKNENNIENF